MERRRQSSFPPRHAGLCLVLLAIIGMLALTGCTLTVTFPASPATTPPPDATVPPTTTFPTTPTGPTIPIPPPATSSPFQTTAPVLSYPHPAQNACGFDLYAVELQVHDLVNDERQRAGLTPLDWSEELADIARGHSQDMAARGYFAHASPEGNNAEDRYAEAGFFAPHAWAENLFYTSIPTPGYFTQDELAPMAVEEWMNSPGHRANLLRQDFQLEGIGIGMAADMGLYFTQNYAG
ncbi:MAG: CAP domain-containing protein [Dehalococcoidia bacterium]|jgi:uncharacterized protein YkwD|nr:CAP domain-containing protein [Dehalococcoidia bacterium]